MTKEDNYAKEIGANLNKKALEALYLTAILASSTSINLGDEDAKRRNSRVK